MYTIIPGPIAREFAIVDSRGETVDVCRTYASATTAIRLLDSGAIVNPHACLGCRIDATR